MAAFTAFAREVAAELAGYGWEWDRWEHLAAVRKPLSGDRFATLFVGARVDGEPMRLRLGLGYQPAADLGAILTLKGVGSLVTEMPIQLAIGEDEDATAVARRVEAAVEEPLGRLTEANPDLDAFLAHFRTGTHVHVVLRRVTLLARAGREAEAREALAGVDAPRFARHLKRWWDAGSPKPPPEAETLARIAPPPLPVRDRRPLRRQLFDVVRVVVRKGRLTRKCLTANRALDRATQIGRVSAAMESAGLTETPIAVAQRVDQFRAGHGLLRRSVVYGRQLWRLGALVKRQVNAKAFPKDPPWLKTPTRAAFPVPGGRQRAVLVALDPDVGDVIKRVAAATEKRVGAFVRLPVWLSREDNLVVAHVGDRRVGTISNSAAFAATFEAAEVFDEDLLTEGTALLEPELMLQVPLPRT